MREWSFSSDGELPLGGEWAFYPGGLLSPGQAAADNGPRFVEVPRSWNSYPESFGFADGQGYATYRLTVLIKPTDRVLALRVPSIFSAYRLWVNGREVASEGKVGTSRATSQAEQYPRIVSFEIGRASCRERVL